MRKNLAPQKEVYVIDYYVTAKQIVFYRMWRHIVI